MDILKIRKKRRDATPPAAEPAASPAPAPVVEKPAPAVEEPVVGETEPVLEKPVLEKPVLEKPVLEKPVLEKPVPEPGPALPPAAIAAKPLPPPAKERSRPRPEAAEPPAEEADPLREFLARFDEGAAEAALEDDTGEAHRADARRFLAFELAGEEYAASIMDIREILRALALTPVPRAPRQILGVVSKRGLVLPVLDLAATLGLRDPDPAVSSRQRVLVVGEGDRVCGLRVDRVLEVVRLRAEDIEEVPASLGVRAKHQLRGLGRVDQRMFILLDVPAVLHGMAVTVGIETREEVV